MATVTYAAWSDYDEMGRVRVRYGNNGQSGRYTYDGNGNVTAFRDSASKLTTFQYDALGRVVSSTDTTNAVTRFEYDSGDRIVKVTDPRNLSTTYVYDGFGQLWAQHSPDTGSTSFQYNASGLRTLATRNDGSTLSFTYDALGRLVWYGTSTQGRLFGYDWCQNGKGRLCEANYGGGARHYGYTPYGQLAITRDFTSGLATDYWTGYSYDNSGRLTGINYPSGVSVGYGYTGGKLSLMNATLPNGTNATVVSGLKYRPFGDIEEWTYGNGIHRLMSTDKDGRLTGINSHGIQGLYYTWNANDEIVRIVNGADAALTQDYGYDALSRLTSAATSGGSPSFGYDGVGNRIHRTDAGVATAYTYASASHHLLSADKPGLARSFTTNGIGNVTTWHGADGQLNSFTYDSYARPSSHTKGTLTTQYTYDALDQRVRKSQIGGNVVSRYVYSGQNRMLADHYTFVPNNTTLWTSYLWLGNTPVGVVKGNALHWVHPDHLNRPEMVTNMSQQRVWRAANLAFERNMVLDQIGGYNLGFPGQYWDVESEVWQNGFRDYESTLGRYLQSDPIGLSGGISTYAYANSNPNNFVDPIGLMGFGTRGGRNPTNPATRDVGAYTQDYAKGTVSFFRAYYHQYSATHILGKQHHGWANQDKYFHCRANCEAAQLGEGGQDAAKCVSNHREAVDLLTGDSIADSAADQRANRYGRSGGTANPNGRCQDVCSQYRPGGTFPMEW